MAGEIEHAKRIKGQIEKDWLAYPGVTAFGIGQTSAGRVCLVVSVNKVEQQILDYFPEMVEGIPVEIQETGEIKAL